MNRALAAGLAATVLGLLGYGLGVFVAYPGRAFSLTVLMFGVALALIGRAGTGDEA